MNPALELTAFRGQPVWELLAAQYLFMIQAGAWALLAGSAAQAWGIAPLERLRTWGTLAGTGLALAAPLNLVAELLSPARFSTMLYRFNISSPLSWGVVAISAFAVLGLANCLALFWPERFPARLPARTVARLASLGALGVLVYTWADLGLAAGIPLWRHPAASVVLASSGLAAGMALCLGLDRLTGGDAPFKLLPRILAATASGMAGLVLLGWGTLGNWPAMPGWPTGTALLAGAGAALALAASLFLRSSSASLWWACLLALVGSYGARLGIIVTGQAAALGRNIGEPHLLGHVGLPLALAPVALGVFFLFAAAISLRHIPAAASHTGGRS